MSETKSDPKTDKRAAAPAVPPGMQPIAVRTLIFTPHAYDVPGKPAAESVTFKQEDADHGRKHWRIELHPWIRSFRIEYVDPQGDPSGTDPNRVRMIHETKASWIPLEP